MAPTIPPMTHPLSRGWDQPPRDAILLDHEHALMEPRAYAALLHYESSVPSGVYAGKMWRRKNRLCWFEDVPGRAECVIVTRKILVLGERSV